MMEKTNKELYELYHRYGLGVALIRKICAYYDNDEDSNKVMFDLSRSMMLLDGSDVFDSYLKNHPEMKR